MVIIGVDPGATGAIAIYDTEAKTLDILDMPTVKIRRGQRMVQEVSAPFLVIDLLTTLGEGRTDVQAWIEKVHAMPGQGVSSMFAFGRCLGIIEGVLAGMRIPMTFVSPAAWTRLMGVTGGKGGSRKRASELFPQYTHLFARAKDDGRSDAALIACFGSMEDRR